MNGVHARRWLLQPGARLNNTYEITRPLAHGGMGEVYVGHSVALGEDVVAIKVILPENARDENFRKLFGREARALLKVRHPAIVGYRSFSHDPGLDLHYIVTDFVEGESLGARLARGPVTGEDFRRLARGLVKGLMAVHEAGIVHRDLAPDNVILEGGEVSRPKIIDFGVVKDTSDGLTTIIGDNVVGKLNFMAPEQLGKPNYAIGPWTDAYSLGLVLVAALRGKAVDMGGSFADAIDKRQTPLDLSDIAPGARTFLTRMLAPHPADRVQSMAEVLALLDAPEGDVTVFQQAAAPPPPPSEREDARRKPAAVPPVPAAQGGFGGARIALAAGAVVAFAAVGFALAEGTGLTDLTGRAASEPEPALTVAATSDETVAAPLAEPDAMPSGTPEPEPEPEPAPTPPEPAPAPSQTPTPAPTLSPRPRPTAIAQVPINPDGPRPQVCNTGPFFVFFEYDRAAVTPEAASVLNAVVQAYKACPAGTRITLAGHTDRATSAAYSRGLSERMASSVQSVLVGKGIDAGRISVVGYGQSRPRIATADGIREAQNRRVEITFQP